MARSFMQREQSRNSDVESSAVGDPRERIVAAARAEFFAHGFARSSMDDLADGLGMSKKTLYRHFRSKDQLIDELITRKSRAMIAGFEEILAWPDLSFAERGARFVQHALQQLSEISVSFLRDVRRFTPRIHTRIETMRAQNFPRMWERLLTVGIKSRSVRGDIDVPFVARLMLVTMQSLLQAENLERLQATPHEVMGRFFNLIFTGLLTESGHADYEKHRSAFERTTPVR